MKVTDVKLDYIKRLYQEKDYPISEGVNICGIRADDQISEAFNDVIIAFKDNNFKAFSATTDPGLYYRLNPINVEGTAILPNGFHHNIWGEGKHRGKYNALVQQGVCCVIRDNNKDDVLNYTIPYNAVRVDNEDVTYLQDTISRLKNIITEDSGIVEYKYGEKIYKVEYGYFGINLHRASKYNTLTTVGKYSAGCQVIADPANYNELMRMVYNDVKGKFSYALFGEREYATISR